MQSRIYKPSDGKCCSACVFRTGPHAAWCPERPRQPSEWLDEIDQILEDAKEEERRN